MSFRFDYGQRRSLSMDREWFISPSAMFYLQSPVDEVQYSEYLKIKNVEEKRVRSRKLGEEDVIVILFP